MKDQSKRFSKLFSQYLPSAMVFKCGLALLIICTVAAFVTAYYHDAYSSILELKELAVTDVWFKLFVILMVVSAALMAGAPLLAMILTGITLLFPSKELEVIREQPAEGKPLRSRKRLLPLKRKPPQPNSQSESSSMRPVFVTSLTRNSCMNGFAKERRI